MPSILAMARAYKKAEHHARLHGDRRDEKHYRAMVDALGAFHEAELKR